MGFKFRYLKKKIDLRNLKKVSVEFLSLKGFL